MSPALIRATGLAKVFREDRAPVHALRRADAVIERGELVAITGKSGSGKSTLMHLLGCLDRPSAGEYLLDGVDVLALDDRAMSRLRATRIGFVFQTFNLLPELSVRENVEMPFLYRKGSTRAAREQSLAAIERVGLAHRLDHRPAELSGGEMQRVAVARALAVGPDVLLADEPTGNLDARTGQEILDLFESLHADGATVILVTHDEEVAARAPRRLAMRDGELAEDARR